MIDIFELKKYTRYCLKCTCFAKSKLEGILKLCLVTHQIFNFISRKGLIHQVVFNIKHNINIDKQNVESQSSYLLICAFS